MRFVGTVAVVTGAASGIGHAVSRRLAEEGAAVALLDRQEEAATAAAAAIVQDGGRAVAVPVDVADRASVERARDRVTEALGRASVVVNCAGIELAGTLFDTTEETWDRVIDVNLKGTWLVSAAFAPGMAEGSGGTIVNIGSTASTLGVADLLAYCASKGGVAQLTRAMAMDGAPKGIRVNAVAPGLVDTPMGNAPAAELGISVEEFQHRAVQKYPIRRVATPIDIADVILFLASDDSRYVTGAMVAVDGGLSAKHPLG